MRLSQDIVNAAVNPVSAAHLPCPGGKQSSDEMSWTAGFSARNLSILSALISRLIDVTAAVCGLMILLPLLAACGLWIKLVDRGPALYWQWRVGHNGWMFRIYKLRTMRSDAERSGARFAEADDPRVLPGCGWMRRSHVDELPQLWNILRGNMSLVGPRPERPEILDWLTREVPGIERRLAGKPGLTGLAQVRNGYTNDLSGARRKLAFDLRYLRRRGPWMDMRLVLATLPKVWDHAAL
jgi:lipopolysaccharide/colanic/teichoic acid biosynthesis glycosyltransferase